MQRLFRGMLPPTTAQARRPFDGASSSPNSQAFLTVKDRIRPVRIPAVRSRRGGQRVRGLSRRRTRHQAPNAPPRRNGSAHRTWSMVPPNQLTLPGRTHRTRYTTPTTVPTPTTIHRNVFARTLSGQPPRRSRPEERRDGHDRGHRPDDPVREDEDGRGGDAGMHTRLRPQVEDVAGAGVWVRPSAGAQAAGTYGPALWMPWPDLAAPVGREPCPWSCSLSFPIPRS